MTFDVFDTAWGAFGIVANGDRLVATYLPGERVDVERAVRRDHALAVRLRGLLPELQAAVRAYYAGEAVRFRAALDLDRFTEFQREVLLACSRIPFGRTASYVDLARAAGRPGAARAVGNTMAKNACPLVIPCHRVLRADGALGGFSGPEGVGQKERMLALEGEKGLRGAKSAKGAKGAKGLGRVGVGV